MTAYHVSYQTSHTDYSLHLFVLSVSLFVLSHYPCFLQPLPRLKFRIAGKMASQWRERWIAGQAKGIEITERIKDAERSGAPAKFKPEQILGSVLNLWKHI